MIKKFILFLLVICLFNINVLASETKKAPKKDTKLYKTPSERFITNLDKKDLNEIWSLKIFWSDSDIKDPFLWLFKFKTFIVATQEKKGDGTPNGFFFNAPNAQGIIYSRVLKGLPQGYIGNGTIPSKRAKFSLFPKMPSKKIKDAKTGLQRYGYDIPSPLYAKEYPFVDLTLGGVKVDASTIGGKIIEGFKNVGKAIAGAFRAIGTLFGGSLLAPPDQGELQTLKYIGTHDYVSYDDSLKTWMQKYWDGIKQIPDNQILVRQSESIDNQGIDSYVNQWIFGNIFTEDIKLMTDFDEIIFTLKEICGPRYGEVMNNVITVAINSKLAEPINTIPIRIMPYENNSLVGVDKEALSYKDPRCSERIFLLLDVPIEPLRYLVHDLSMKFIDSGSAVSETTNLMNSMMSFSFLENIGMDTMVLYNSAIMNVLLILVGIIGVVQLAFHGVKCLNGNGGFSKLIGKFLIYVFVVTILVLISKTTWFYGTLKKYGGAFLNPSQMMFKDDKRIGNLFQGDAAENADCTIWLPYFGLWTKYNTGYTLMSDENVIDVGNADNEPEQKSMNYPKINNNEILLWSANSADSVTRGVKIQNSIYRTVDHFMAPRIDWYGEGSRSILSSRENENFNNKFQTFPDLGIWFSILVIFLAVLIKLIFFVEMVLEIILLPGNISLALGIDRQVKTTILRFGVSFVRILLWDLLVGLIIWSSINFEEIFLLLLSVGYVVLMFKIISGLMQSRSIWCPRFFMFATNKAKRGVDKVVNKYF